MAQPVPNVEEGEFLDILKMYKKCAPKGALLIQLSNLQSISPIVPDVKSMLKTMWNEVFCGQSCK